MLSPFSLWASTGLALRMKRAARAVASVAASCHHPGSGHNGRCLWLVGGLPIAPRRHGCAISPIGRAVRFWRHPARCTAIPVIQPTPRPARPARRSRLCPHWLLGQRSMCKGLPNGYTFSGASISARRIFTCSLLLHNAAWIAGWNCAAHRRPCRWQPQFCGMTVPDCFLYMGRYVNLDFLSLTDHKKKTVRNSHFCQIARLQLWPSSLQPIE